MEDRNKKKLSVLMLGSGDTKLVEEPSAKNEYVRYRHVQYAARIGHLHIALKTGRRADLKVRDHSDRLTAYPTLSSNSTIGLWDLYRLGARIIREKKVDIIVTSDPFGPGLIGYLLKKRTGLPLCVQMFGDYVFNDIWQGESIQHRLVGGMGRWLFARADAIRVHGERVRGMITQKLGVSPEKVFVVPIPLRKEMFVNIGRERNEIRARFEDAGFKHIVLFIGRLVPQKDLTVMLRAAQMIAAAMPDTAWCLVAGGPLREMLMAETARLGIGEKVFFEGEVPHKEIPKYYEACDLFALSSAYEDTPRVLIEAAAAGRPIVTTDTTGSRDVVRDGRTGYVVPVGDDRALAEKIGYLLAHPETARAFGAAGREAARDMFDDEKIIDSVIGVWEYTAQKKNGTS